MTVLNTYVERSVNGFVIFALFIILMVVIVILLKDDITRFLEHHTIGAKFYSLMKYVWLVPLIIFVMLFFVSMSKCTEEHIYVEATIKDNYPIGPLYEKYEITEKRGEIWVLEQRPTWQEDVDSGDTEGEK